MRVTVRLFGRLHDLVGASELPRDVADGATVADVWQRLADEYPALAAYGRSISAAVNADFSRMSAPVRDGDEVAFLPPVSGGSGGSCSGGAILLHFCNRDFRAFG